MILRRQGIHRCQEIGQLGFLGDSLRELNDAVMVFVERRLRHPKLLRRGLLVSCVSIYRCSLGMNIDQLIRLAAVGREIPNAGQEKRSKEPERNNAAIHDGPPYNLARSECAMAVT